jgi:hypothetical protein
MINVSSSVPPTGATKAPLPPQQATTQPNPDLTQQTQQQPVVEQKKNDKNRYFLIGGVILAILAIGGLVSLFLVQEPQDIRQQAAQCKEECPSTKDGVLRNCTPPEADGSSEDSICSAKGRVESCGGKEYCCPSPGGTWTTDMTACATPTPEPSPTEVPGDCSTDSVAVCRTSNPGDSCGGAEETCVADGTTGADDKQVCNCEAPEPTAEPTVEPTDTPEPTAAPTDAPEPTTAPTSAPTTAATSTPTQPPLPSELPETGPEDWLKNLSIGLGALGAGALLFLFL